MEQFNDPTMQSDSKNNDSVPSSSAMHAAEGTVTDGEAGEHRSHHHHHHHHRHRHHSGHHSSHHKHHKHHKHRNGDHNKRENRLVAFLKRNRSVLVNVLACTLAFVMLILYATDRDQATNGGIVPPGDGVLPADTVRIDSSFYTEDVALASQAVLDYLNPELQLTAPAAWKKYQNTLVRMDAGLPITYSYGVSGLPEGVSVVGAEMLVSNVRSFADAKSYAFAANANTLKIYNLFPNTQYYYQVHLTFSNGSTVGTLGEFRTVASSRMLNVDGANTVRDIGGWKTESGKIIPYGLLYRGSEIDGAVEPDYRITETGVMEMLTHLGVRTDIDLRYSADQAPHTNVLGSNVNYLYFPAGMYSGIFEESKEEITRAIFSALADESNYPVYLHCTYGRDRTGTVCYLLEALLGVSREDLRREYDLSAFVSGYLETEEYIQFSTRMEMRDETKTLSENVEAYLLSIGVTQAEIENIRTIFLGE